MDRSLQNSFYGNRSLSGPSKTRPSTIFNRKSGMFKKNVSLSGRSNASTMQIVARSEYNLAESFGLPLPVQIQEALAFSDSAISVNFSSNGWAWVVSGRKLLVWQYKDSKSSSTVSEPYKASHTKPRNTTSQCRILTLPHCDIGHKARLITVFENNPMAVACLAVSTTGDVRYWPSIAHDGSSIDENGILEGQEFDQLLCLNDLGYVLCTTTCNLVLLQLQVQNGRQKIVHRTIRPPTGFFGGFGKKVASIIIGFQSSQETENKLIKVSCEPINSAEFHITILSDNSLQRWLFSPNSSEQFLYDCPDIGKKIREFYRQKVWPSRDLNENFNSWLMDMQPVDRGVIVLVGAVNLSHTPHIHFALITFLAEPVHGFQLKEFQLLRYKAFFNFDQPQLHHSSLIMKFLLCRGIGYIYNDKTIYPQIMSQAAGLANDDIEKIEFPGQEDKILSAANHNNIPLFFSKVHGLVSITPSDFEPDAFNNSVSSDIFNQQMENDASFIATNILSPNTTNIGNLTMYELDPEEIIETNKDAVSRLKAAFIYHMKRNNGMCSKLLEQLVQPDSTQVDSDFDRIILTIAQDLAEDVPSADPRWENAIANKFPLGSSTSMQIIQQLREKNVALGHFIEFLHATGLWGRLYAVTEKGKQKSTGHILSDLNEKIVGAITLKCLHNSHSRIIDEAIEMVLKDNNLQAFGSLTNQDLFYIKITKLQELFRHFALMIDDYVNMEYSTVQIQNTIHEINTIVLKVLSEVAKFRESKAPLYALPAEKMPHFEYLPWTAAADGLRDSLLQLISLTLRHGIKLTGEPEYLYKHYQQMTELIDFVLDGKRRFLLSVQSPEKRNVLQHQFESQRFDLIYPLIEGDQYELAAKLGEKYLDFQTLVIICDKTDNQQRLDEYIERFHEFDFSQFAISWHMKQNKQGDLFERFKNNQVELAKFLGNHPSLAWIQLIFNGEMEKASNVLLHLAQNEQDLVARKRTMLSLAKLSALAAESDLVQQINEINSELHLIEHQELLPQHLLLAFGYDINNQRVLQPEEIIDIYISEDNENPSEVDYRKALELLEYVEEPLEYRHKIWCGAIKNDSWVDYNMNSPLDALQDLLFFKLIDLCYILDNEIENFLPPIDSFLTALELGPLINEKSFQFLLKLGYEHIYESYSKQ